MSRTEFSNRSFITTKGRFNDVSYNVSTMSQYNKIYYTSKQHDKHILKNDLKMKRSLKSPT